MDEAYRIAIDEGDEASQRYVLANRVKLEVRAGRWAEAERLIHESVAIVRTLETIIEGFPRGEWDAVSA